MLGVFLAVLSWSNFEDSVLPFGYFEWGINARTRVIWYGSYIIPLSGLVNHANNEWKKIRSKSPQKYEEKIVEYFI